MKGLSEPKMILFCVFSGEESTISNIKYKPYKPFK